MPCLKRKKKTEEERSNEYDFIDYRGLPPADSVDASANIEMLSMDQNRDAFKSRQNTYLLVMIIFEILVYNVFDRRHLHTVKYCGWLYFRRYQFSWIEEKSNIRGVEIRGHSIFLIIHTENRN